MKTTMNKTTKLAMVSLFGAGLVLSVSVGWAGIVGSKHDLSGAGNSQIKTEAIATVNGEVCVFCHTPHGANTGASAPLWNKSLPTTNYTRYSSLGTSTLDGSEAPVGSVSLACLSCHDGTQAMDVMVNKPGTGGYTAGGASAGAGATMSGTPLPNLGGDLSNDHPISIQYAGGGLSSAQGDGAYTSTAFTDKDFKSVRKATINSNPVWWVDSNADGVRQKTEMMLYTRDVGGSVQPYVECASCHDPHNAATSGTYQVAFLRQSNAASAVCLACHDK